MPNLNITEGQFRVASQNIQSRLIRLELLNYQYQTVDSLEGVCLSGSFNIDANADIRRTGSIELVIRDSSFEVEVGGKIWLDKYIRVWIGTVDMHTGKIEWTNCGIYIIDAPAYRFDATTNTLSLSLLDLMAKLSGLRNGYLKGIPTLLKAGENIRKAIIDTLALGGFTKYVVEEAPEPGVIPNDLEFGQGSTIYDLLTGLKNIYPDHEMFFDINGTFFYKKIPTGMDDPVLIDDTLWTNIVVSEDIDADFQNVKNSIEVFGRTHNPAAFAKEATVSSNTINLTSDTVTAYTKDMIYGFVLKDNPGYTNMNLKINNLASLPVTLDDGKTKATIKAESGEIYFCVQYKETYWNWLGHLQSYGFAEDTNKDSPFYVEGTVGRIRLPLFGGEYENIFSDDLARQRAEYELWLHTNMNNTIQLSCVLVPWMDVNILVEYTSCRNNVKAQYLIKSINFGLSPTDNMTVKMIKFYPEQASITNRK